MRAKIFAACSLLILAGAATATSPPAVDTAETIARNPTLTQFRALLGDKSFDLHARISLIAPVDGTCAGDALNAVATGPADKREAFISTHALQGFIYTNGYDVDPTNRPVSVTWGTPDHQLHRIFEGERLTVPTVAGGTVTLKVVGGQVLVGNHVVPRGGVDVAMNGSVVAINGCDPLE